ncbi:MAG: hypothetical protein MUO19_07085 [Dehalococcoidales bacterium]|nr:hypothetical protein [Dehalococcoidales bacterium]
MKQRVKVRVEEKDREQPPTEACGHFWVIEDPNGPTSMGKCKYCGEKREFYNGFPGFNPLRYRSSPMNLPELPEVRVEKGSKS